MPKQPKTPSGALKHTQVESFSVAGVSARMAPSALHFYADAYVSAARGMVAGSLFNPVRSYLACHALELALKAVLSLKERSLRELAGPSFSHGLANLLAQAEQHGLTDFISLTPEQRDQLTRASDYYSEKVFEYPALDEAAIAYPQMPDIGLVIAVTDALVGALHDPCSTA